jgi:predicted RNA methylase
MQDGQDIPNEVQTTGLSRNPIDKYYTKEEVVELCVNYVKQKIKIIKTKDIVVEPSAGNGVFYNALLKICKNIRLFDIKPDSDIVTQMDFLHVTPQTIQPNRDISTLTIHTIGNPPFGRQSSMAIKFIKHAATFSKTISFILPKSFKKYSMRKAFPLSFHLIFECDLPEKSFTVNGEDHDSPCVFQIWEKKNTNRIVDMDIEPNGYKFVKKDKSPSISLRRVGGLAGKADIETINKSEQSHYFIQLVNENLIPKVSFITEQLNNVEYESNNTVGPKSISKSEFTKQINKVIENINIS